MNRYIRLIAALTCLVAWQLNAREVDWVRLYGSTEHDWAHSVAVAPDGTIAVAAGWNIGPGSGHLKVFKLDPNGTLLWDKDMGPKVSKADRDPALYYRFALAVTGKGELLVAGGKNPRSKLWGGRMLHKLDPDGNLVWEREFVEKNAFITYTDLAVRPDDSIVLVGRYDRDPFGEFGSQCWIQTTDPEGVPVFHTDWGADRAEDANSVALLPQGGFVIGGMTLSWGAGSADFFLTRVDEKNDLLWHHEFGGKEPDEIHDVATLPNGEIIAAGYTMSFGKGGKDMYVVKTDPEGAAMWERSFGTPQDDTAYAVTVTGDGRIVVAGTGVLGALKSTDIVIMELDDAGNHVWSTSMGGAQDDGAYGLASGPDGSVYVVGFTASSGAGKRDIYIVKLR